MTPDTAAPSVRAVLRAARPDDAAAIQAILNHYIARSTSTFMTEPVTLESRQTFITQRDARHPLWVAELDGITVGWAALSPHQARSAYAETAESSIYLHPHHTGQGLGTRLMTRVVAHGIDAGFHTLVAGACAEQAASIALHERAGYQRCAHFREVARKFGRWLDVIYLQRLLRPA
jgi:L-amino acid N-acyltransferase